MGNCWRTPRHSNEVRDDVEAQRLVPTALDWPQAVAGACGLSESCTPSLLTRSLDLLHVAAARARWCKVFVSADDRQLAAAKAAGLKPSTSSAPPLAHHAGSGSRRAHGRPPV